MDAARNKPSQVTPWEVLDVIWGYAHHAQRAARWTPYTVRRARVIAMGSARRRTRDAGGDERESKYEMLAGGTQDATHETLVEKAGDDAGERVGEGVRDPRTRRWLEARQELRATLCSGRRDNRRHDAGQPGTRQDAMQILG